MTTLPPNAKSFSSREFNQKTSEAKKAAIDGPVFITDRGEPAYVLLGIAEYRRLIGKPLSLAEALEQKGGAEIDFDFDPPRMGEITRVPDLT